jgi:hypothetical protein
MPRRAAHILALVVLSVLPAGAQVPPVPPGPYVVDLRGALGGFPDASGFFPAVPTGTVVPSRGFGIDAGGHVYLFDLGPARIGVGLGFVRVHHRTSPDAPASSGGSSTSPPAPRTIPDVAATLTTFAPQLSFNFGTADGWSYLSAGLGRARVKTETSGIERTATQDSGSVSSLNFGGGARWFRSDRLAITFDVRFHMLGAGKAREAPTPKATVVTASAGISIR